MYRVSLTWLLVVYGACAFAADDAPLRIRNLAPASGIYGEPRALGGDVLAQGYEITFNTEVANNFTSAANGATLAFFDGETRSFTYGIRQAVAERFEWGVELPWIVHDGGYLDHSIERFHSVFGFPNNGRREAKLNQIDYFIANHNKVYVDFQDEKDGLGDIRVGGGYQLLRDTDRSLAVRALVKLPTGDMENLTGSGATDVAAWLDYTDRELLARWRLSLTGAVGLMVLGDGDLLPREQNRVAPWGHFGLGFAVADAWTIKGQLDYTGQLIDTSVDQLGGEALQGTLGVSWRVTPRLWADLAMVEDLIADSTSDVMVQLLIGTKF
jgi:hypothetical protein